MRYLRQRDDDSGAPLAVSFAEASDLVRRQLLHSVEMHQRSDYQRQMLLQTLTRSSVPMLLRHEDRNSLVQWMGQLEKQG